MQQRKTTLTFRADNKLLITNLLCNNDSPDGTTLTNPGGNSSNRYDPKSQAWEALRRRLKNSGPEASWRRMFITQPPIRRTLKENPIEQPVEIPSIPRSVLRDGGPLLVVYRNHISSRMAEANAVKTRVALPPEPSKIIMVRDIVQTILGKGKKKEFTLENLEGRLEAEVYFFEEKGMKSAWRKGIEKTHNL